MARTRDTRREVAQHAAQPVNSDVPPRPKSTAKTTAKSKSSRTANDAGTVELEQPAKNGKPSAKSKSSRTANDTGTVELEQPANNGKSSASKPKRQREVDTTAVTEDEQTAPMKKPRTAPKTAKNKPDVSPRPQRSSRATTKASAAPQKRKRRTKEEIAADKAASEAKKRQQEVLTQEKHRAMAQMDINEDVDKAEMAARTVRTFADLDRETESGVEEFVGYNSVPSSDDSDLVSDAEVPVKLKETRKVPPKAKVDGGKKNGVGGKKNNKKITFASGLRQDWESAIKERPKTRAPHVQISAGGLDDSDVDDVNPYSSKSRPLTMRENEVAEGAQKAKRDFSRRNEMVSIVASDEEEYVPHAATKKIAIKTPRPVQVKSEKNEGSVPVTTAVIPKPKARRLNGNNVRRSDLPNFAQGKWRSTFLPTLYERFFTSDEPFDEFNAGSDEFVALLQSIIKEVYPNVDYEVTSSDSIHFLAYNRINEKRSNIGINALKMLKAHIKTLKVEDEQKIWLRWSLRGDGPLFFKVPSPMGLDHKDPKYRLPEGRLLSQFVIDLAAPLLRLRASSLSKNGHPKGLVALILAALERAARYLSKPSISPKEFSKEHYGSKVKTYHDGFHGKNGIPDDRWEEFVEVCGGPPEDRDEDTLEADLSILDHERPFIFDFCSPAKSRT